MIDGHASTNGAARGKRRLVFFIHVPKSAGTTVARLLRATEGHVLTTRNVFRGGGGVVLSPNYAQIIENIRAEPRARFLHGHTPYGIDGFVPPEWHVDYITFLRNPVDRALSHYFRQMEFAEKKKQSGSVRSDVKQIIDVPIEERFTSLSYVPDNLHTRMLCGLPEPFGEVTQEMADLALENLKTRFAMFGLAERFEDSIFLLKERLGYRTLIYRPDQRVNSQRPGTRDVSPEVLAAATAANRFDTELYQAAKELFVAAPEIQEIVDLGAVGEVTPTKKREKRSFRIDPSAEHQAHVPSGASGPAKRQKLPFGIDPDSEHRAQVPSGAFGRAKKKRKVPFRVDAGSPERPQARRGKQPGQPK